MPVGMADAIPPAPVAGPSTPPRIAKIILIGDSGCGKTSLRNRYLRGPGSFSQAYIATIGADFVTKRVELADGTSVSVQFWDTAGQERFQALGAAFYRGADACILVYSRTSKQSYQKLESWYSSFIERYPLQEDQVKTYPFVCIGNKNDLVRSTDTSNVVDEDEVETLLARLLPKLQPDIRVHEDQHPSSFHIESHPDEAQEQQTREIQPHASAQHLHRHSSDTSSHRRSLEILPDTLHRSNSRGPSVYHTPSSSLAYSSWIPKQSASTPSSTSPTRTASSFLRKDVPLDVVHPHEPPESMLDGQTPAAAPEDDEGTAASQVFGAMDGIKHFTASAKTGDNIDEIFEYVVQRISARWKWQDEQDMLNGRLSLDGPDNVRTGGKNDSIKVGDPPKAERKGWRAGCC